MSDWDFLHDMHNDGYSAEQIADAATCGYNPWEWQLFDEVDLAFVHEHEDSKLVEIFNNLVNSAKSYHSITGRYLQIWGELGELFGEIKYGIKRHKPHTRGSDGKLGNDFIEIKTISPEKIEERVQVKRAGNFNKLLLIKITKDFNFEGRLIKRKELSKGEGTHARVSWQSLPTSDE